MNSPDSHLSVKVINVLDCKWTKALLLSFHRRLSGNHLRHIPGPVLQGLYNLKVLWVTKDRKSESVFVSVNASMEKKNSGWFILKKTCSSVIHCKIRNRTADRWWFRFCSVVNGQLAVPYAWVFVDVLLTDCNFIDWLKTSWWSRKGQTKARHETYSRQHTSQNFHTGFHAPFRAVLEASVNLPCIVI